ncbi:MAG: PKD domain-containing protein [Saprospiraceae bacterium]|jgi:gliding motility-associated-like protein|nr:PKD domain-containing protein [Saprospiraceae bacterium]HNA75210.1 PKD domain-containing protein [Saprospiraceae bacterium]HNF20970.1 PKD domain-containing protein [Saprospiraceae bacterium]HNH39869.1 PKD domain-containing protein [Saprospiraceae bacterium]HNK08070.1 PKD domain-containing protein [Saprospiraceae bacterium]
MYKYLMIKNNNTSHKTFIAGIGKLVVAIILFMVGSFQAHATHIVGGEVTYTCLGNNKYRITLTVYRDCFYADPNVTFDNPAWLGFYSTKSKTLVSNVGALGVVNIPYDATDTLDQILTSECNIEGQDVCVHRAVYDTVVTLPYLVGGYTIVYQRCCRNQTLMNIDEPLNTGAIFSVEITDEALLACNSSPRYEFWPPIYVCAGTPLNYDHGAIDNDGDSIVYRVCNPFVSGDTAEGRIYPPPGPPFDTVTWANGFGLHNLLGGPDPLKINPSTGFITGTPVIIGQFLVGICAEEYRNGVLLSRIRRDFQYNVRNCSNPTEACFKIPDTLCNTTVIPFINCSKTTTDYEWTFYKSDGSVMATSTEFEPVITYPDYGTYKVQLIASKGPACRDTMVDNIVIRPTVINADFALSVPDCGSSITIKTVNNSTNGSAFQWTVEKDGTLVTTSTASNPEFNVSEEGTYIVHLIAFHQNGCSDTTQKSITVHLLGKDNIVDFHELCKGESVELNPNGNPDYQYTWTPATYLTPGGNVPNPVSTPLADISYVVSILDAASGCVFKDTVNVKLSREPNLGFSTSNDCGSLTVQFTNTTNPPVDSYLWDFGDGTATSTDVNPSHTFPASGSYWVKIHNTSGCERVDSQLVKVNYIDIESVNDSIYLCGADRVHLNPNGNPAYSYVWEPAEKISGSNTVANPEAVVDQYTVFTVKVSDPTFSDCFVTGRVAVQVAKLIMNVDDAFVCVDDPITINANLLGDTPVNIHWTPDDNRIKSGQGTPSITVIGEKNEVYTITVEFAGGCILTGSTNLKVGTFGGDVSASIALDTIYNFETVQLFAFPPGLAYLWAPAEGLNNPTAQDPVYKPGPIGDRTFTVTVTNPDNCSRTATVKLFVKQTLCDGDHVFLPNAFSPDGKGDQRNETLRLFQDGIVNRLNSFIVYNRFGQEVYSTKDINFEWNGTFQGRVLDPDVYGYYLDVDCIDGQSFKIKGNITLIR